MAEAYDYEIGTGVSVSKSRTKKKNTSTIEVQKTTTSSKSSGTPSLADVLAMDAPAEKTAPITYEPHQRTTGGGGVNSVSGAAFDTSTGTYNTVSANNQAFREADAQNWNAIQEQQAMERIAEVETSNIQTVEPEPVRNRALNEFSMNLSKSARYRKMASNLSTLASDRTNSADEKDKNWAIGTSIHTVLASLVGLAFGGAAGMKIASGLATAINTGANALFNTSGKDREQSELYSQMQGNITAYLTNLTNRDTTIMNTMDQIYSSMDNMRATYGTQFVDTMYNYFLAKSGMTSDAYSLLTGNFNTFEDIGYGKVSEDGQIFDTLTDGNQNLFNNIYAQLQLGDITGNQSLLDNMVQSLYGADTELAIALQGYENDLRTALKSSISQQSQAVWQTKTGLESESVTARSENISATEQIGSAEAESASSGLRGGTMGNNAALARLSRDLGQIQRTANVASMIGTLKYNIQNAQLNASSTAYSYRMAQKKAVNNALNNAVLSFNSINRSAQSTERTANYYLDEAQYEQKQFNEKFESVAEDDKDRIFEVTQG